MPVESKTDPNEHIEATRLRTPTEAEVVELMRNVVYDGTITRMHKFTRETEWGEKTSVAINFDDNTVMFTSGFETQDAEKFMVDAVLPATVQIQRVQVKSSKSDNMVNRLYITRVE